MEKSALVYVLLTVVTIGFALCIDNKEYVSEAISGRREFGVYKGYQRRQARNTVAEFAIYALLSGVSACRIAVGNDYWVYRDNFKLIAQDRHVSSESGFNLIVRGMVELFGYDNYLPIFGLFSLVTVFFFVKALHDQGENYAFSLFLLLTGGYYFQSLNSVRYYLALAMALFSMRYVLRGEYGKFVLWIIVGALFHKSILLVIPVYLAARFLASVKLKLWHYAMGAALILSLVFGQDIYRKIIFFFYPYYENSIFDNGELSYVNIGKCLGALALSAVSYKTALMERRKTEEVPEESTEARAGNLMGNHAETLRLRFYFFLNLAGFVVYCCGSFIPEVSRVGYYLIISQVFLLPGLLERMKKGWLRNLCTTGVIGAFSLYFVILLKQMYAVDVRLLPYLNWIFD